MQNVFKKNKKNNNLHLNKRWSKHKFSKYEKNKTITNFLHQNKIWHLLGTVCVVFFSLSLLSQLKRKTKEGRIIIILTQQHQSSSSAIIFSTHIHMNTHSMYLNTDDGRYDRNYFWDKIRLLLCCYSNICKK